MTAFLSLFRWAGGLVSRIRFRDACFWVGLALAWLGIARLQSVSLASAVIGGALFLVAVFGIAPARRSE